MIFSKGKMGVTLGALAFLTVTNAWATPPTPAPTPKTFQPCDCKAYLPASQGLRGSLELGLVHKKLAASLNYSGALGFLIDEPSLIEESALQRLRAATRYQLSDGVDLGLDLQLTGIDTVPETPLEVTGTAFVGGTL
jgi:hypothetical protein